MSINREGLAALATLGAEQSKPVLDEIRNWLMTQRSALGAGGQERPVAGTCARPRGPEDPARESAEMAANKPLVPP